jgi:uncharacterized phage protein (TIGR02218 family)
MMGFTDHDRALVFDAVTYAAQAGFTGSEIESALGFSVDNLEATGALQSGLLDSARLKAGDFDHAEIEIYRVNWQDVSQRILLRKGHLGEVTFGEFGFSAEVRGLSHLLNQPKGRLYQYGCDAVLGDTQCGVDLSSNAYSAIGIVSSVGEHSLTFGGINTYTDDFFTRGTLTWTSGANLGRLGDIKRHRAVNTIELWQAAAFPLNVGDTAVLKAGCDKQFSTCRAKFFNGANFRGFPHMPGTDFVTGFAG